MITAKQVRAARDALGWSQEQTAEAADIHQATVNNVERGRNALFSTLSKIHRLESPRALKWSMRITTVRANPGTRGAKHAPQPAGSYN